MRRRRLGGVRGGRLHARASGLRRLKLSGVKNSTMAPGLNTFGTKSIDFGDVGLEWGEFGQCWVKLPSSGANPAISARNWWEFRQV